MPVPTPPLLPFQAFTGPNFRVEPLGMVYRNGRRRLPVLNPTLAPPAACSPMARWLYPPPAFFLAVLPNCVTLIQRVSSNLWHSNGLQPPAKVTACARIASPCPLSHLPNPALSPPRVRHPFPNRASNVRHPNDILLHRKIIDTSLSAAPARFAPPNARILSAAKSCPALMAPKSYKALPRPRYVTFGAIEYHRMKRFSAVVLILHVDR